MIRLVLTLLTVLCTVTSKIVIEDGYYWRDYKQKIPKDAVPCGLDNSRAPIYIGQALHKNMLIPGKIYSNNSDIYFHLGPEIRVAKNIKILCSPFPAQFEWISTNLNEVSKLTNKVFVEGGYEPTFFTYLGRLNAGEETTVGKVICRINGCLGFFYTLNGSGVKHEGLFDILVYNYDKE